MKMGYYPTPESVSERIRSFLEYPSRNVNLLDPCCGEGIALRDIAVNVDATTYGVEPDDFRAKRADEALDHVLHCSYEDVMMSNNAFSCVLLNPPYDWQLGYSENADRQERTEKTFLKGTVRYLMPEGVLVYIVPQHRVREDVAKILQYKFHDLSAYRFQDGEYEPFSQIVLFGRKRAGASRDNDGFGPLNSIRYGQLDEIPHLAEPRYAIPASPEVKIFKSMLIDEAELERELGVSALWEKLKGQNGSNGNGVARPPLPLHTGHLGLLLASGCLDGPVGEGDDRHIVRGKVEKVANTMQEYDGDVLVERTVERYKVSVKVLTPDGQIRNLM